MPQLPNDTFCAKCPIKDFGDISQCNCKATIEGYSDCFGLYGDAPNGGNCDFCKSQDKCIDRTCDLGEAAYYHEGYYNKFNKGGNE